MRYLFSDEIDIPWTEEFGRLAMIWAAFWGAAMLQRADDHIRMSAVYDLLPAALQKAVRVFGDLLVICWCWCRSSGSAGRRRAASTS